MIPLDVTVSLELPYRSTIDISTWNRWGRQLDRIEKKDPVPTGYHHFHFDISGYGNGTYYLQAITERDTVSGWLVKIGQ